MTTWPKAFATACIFLTRLPMPFIDTITPEDEGRSLACFPVVGALIGALLCLIGLILYPILSTEVLAAVLVTAWAAITGGLHLDGLADSADGWLGGFGDVDRTLEIMQDSRSGAAAIIAVTCLLILKFSALIAIIEHQLWVSLLVAAILGRCIAPLLFVPKGFLYTPYVRPSGIAEHFIHHAPAFSRQVSYFAIFICAVLLQQLSAAIGVIALCAVMMLYLQWLMKNRLGGSTGDTAGACTEIIETLVLISAGVLLT